MEKPKENRPGTATSAALPASTPSCAKGRGKAALLSVFLFLFVVGAFWPALKGEFLYYDEHWHILDNQHVKTWVTVENLRWSMTSFHAANWHPLTWFSHMLDSHIYGEKAWGHHLTNILLHGVNAVLVFLVFR